jgi:hypothetical protein
MDFHVLTTHTRDGDDGTPLQLISVAQLDHYRRCEAELAAIKAQAADQADVGQTQAPEAALSRSA